MGSLTYAALFELGHPCACQCKLVGQMLLTILRDEWRLLTFRAPSAAMAQHWQAYLVFGLVCTWLAGMGRYWDHPNPDWYQRLGLGSLAYVFVLALLLRLVIWPLRARHWSVRNVLLFVTLTSPPALLYAIPVERFLSLPAAQSANAWFLGIVAIWRLALLSVFLTRVGKLRPEAAAIGVLLPMALILVALTALNLEHVVFSIMSGIRPEQQSGNDQAYAFVVTLTMLSTLASPLLLIWYVAEIYRAYVRSQYPEKLEPPRRG